MRLLHAALLAPAALLLCSAVQAAPNAHQQYLADRAACASGPAADRAACIREAGAAAQAARQGGLTTASASTYEHNALARCDVFKNPEDKSDCVARMGSKASVQGSVDGGGILRESVRTYTVPAK
ncbi:MAG: hypothetical protein KGM60_11510 [Comamonadaceae bacterium]|nr:hypothetical protein [Pseudomonadota bacterium]MBS0611261.1 hypothetical protein [Pseudomonadota bacterium]MDE2415376.1 hypothetical protein [Comamonadaceae bacterium]